MKRVSSTRPKTGYDDNTPQSPRGITRAPRGIARAPRGITRRGFFVGAGAAGAVAATTAIGATPAGATPSSLPAAVPVPEPIPGGFLLDPTDESSIIHFLLPGPPGSATQFFGFPGEGLDVDPSTMTNFRGDHAFAVLAGQATGSDGATYNVEFDLRIYSGSYIAADGVERDAAFAFM